MAADRCAAQSVDGLGEIAVDRDGAELEIDVSGCRFRGAIVIEPWFLK